MGNLPEDRLKVNCVFTNVGIEYTYWTVFIKIA